MGGRVGPAILWDYEIAHYGNPILKQPKPFQWHHEVLAKNSEKLKKRYVSKLFASFWLYDFVNLRYRSLGKQFIQTNRLRRFQANHSNLLMSSWSFQNDSETMMSIRDVPFQVVDDHVPS